MSVWSGTVPARRRSRWLLLLLAIIAALFDPEVDESPDEPGTNFGGW